MPADKRKGAEKSKAGATPAKKRKVETPKAKSAAKKVETPKRGKAPTPKVTSTKAKKAEPKKTPTKATPTPAKATKVTPKPASAKKNITKTPAKATKTPAKATKTPAKATKTPAKATKEVKKPIPVKKEVPKKAAVQPKPQPKPKAAVSVTRAKLDKAKALKARAVTAKAKLKSTKTLPRGKVAEVKKTGVVKKVVIVKKPKPEEKSEETKEETAAPEKKTPAKATPAAVKKRKAETPTESTDSSRKRRMVTPNKKFADYELDVPAKRTITPNKKYADYETDAMPKSGKVSELRAFIQEKKSVKPETEEPPKPEKKKPAGKATPGRKSAAKESSPEEDESEEKIKVFKASEMKPAEKLLKKLQKKLEKEAKGASPASPSENREKAKIKITKVVDYKKPLSSEDVEMKKLAKKIALNKPKPASPAKPKVQLQKTPKAAGATQEKPKTTPRIIKGTPKQAQVEKVAKPKKIRDMKREERPIQAKFVSQKVIQLPDDNQNVHCWITGISVFPSGEIIMVDMSNRRIKLFSKDFEFLSKVKLDAIPQDISVSPVNASFAYFTKPFSKEGIQKVAMSDGKLTLKEFFTTNGTNRGITCTKAGIFTSVQNGRYHDVDINHFKVLLLDYTGNVLQSVSTDPTGSRLFKLPLYFTVNSTGKQMIVADCIKQNSYVLNVDMDGKIKFKYEGMNNNPITPRGLTIDESDNIYVTEWERNNIYILSPTGKRLQMLFSHAELQQEKVDGLLKPYQLCYYKAENQRRLIVSQESSNKVKIFKLMSREEMEAENAAIAAKKKVDEEAKAKIEIEKKKVVAASTSKAEAEVKTDAAPPKEAETTKAEEIPEPSQATEESKVVEEASPVKAATVPQVVKMVAVTNTNGQVTKQIAAITTKLPETVPVTDKKEDIFADTADDFNDDAENEADVNGKLQDIVDAFPGDNEAETVESTGAEIVVTIPQQTSQPPAEVLDSIAPTVVDVIQPQQTVIEQIIVPTGSEQLETGTVTSDIIQQSIDAANNVDSSIIETVVVSENATTENAFHDFQTIVYDSVPHVGEMTIVNEQAVIDTVVTSDPDTVNQVTSETMFVPEYQNVVTDVPVELETITTEYVV